jgi:predicted dehydrogenase
VSIRPRPVGVALIGTGMWAGRMAAAERRAGLRLVTCFSRDAERRRAFAQSAGCGAAPSLAVALEHPDVEAALILTPNDTHADIAAACAERGIAVFVEKPIADTVADAERIAAACRDAGVTLMQVGIHHVDTLALLGEPVAATGRFARLETEADIDDVGAVTLQMASGSLAVVTGSYVSPKTFAIRLTGTRAVLDYRADFSVWPAAERLDAVTALELDGAPVGFEERDMLAEEPAELARFVRTGAVPETGAAEGIAALRAIRGALEGDRAWQPAPR